MFQLHVHLSLLSHHRLHVRMYHVLCLKYVGHCRKLQGRKSDVANHLMLARLLNPLDVVGVLQSGRLGD